MSDDFNIDKIPAHIDNIMPSVNRFYGDIDLDPRFNPETNPDIISCSTIDLEAVITDEALLSEVRSVYANPVEVVKKDGSRFYIFLTGLSPEDYNVPNITTDLKLMKRLGAHLNSNGISPYLIEFFPGGFPKLGRIPAEDLLSSRDVATKYRRTFIDNSTDPMLLTMLSRLMPTVEVIGTLEMLDEIAKFERLNVSGSEA
jgi:hypothetical protein